MPLTSRVHRRAMPFLVVSRTCVAVVLCCGFATGPAVAGFGWFKLHQVSKFNASADFVSLGSVCNVTAIDICWESSPQFKARTSKQGYYYRCQATLVYQFASPLGVVWSREETVMTGRISNDCLEGCWYDSGRRANWGTGGMTAYMEDLGSFHTRDAMHECWRPALPTDAADSAFRSVYDCGAPNGDCIKLFAPADEIASAESFGRILLFGGGALGGLSLLGLLLLLAYQIVGWRQAKAQMLLTPTAHGCPHSVQMTEAGACVGASAQLRPRSLLSAYTTSCAKAACYPSGLSASVPSSGLPVAYPSGLSATVPSSGLPVAQPVLLPGTGQGPDQARHCGVQHYASKI